MIGRPLKEGMYRSTGYFDRQSGDLTVIYSAFSDDLTGTRLLEEVYDYDSLMTALSDVDSVAGVTADTARLP